TRGREQGPAGRDDAVDAGERRVDDRPEKDRAMSDAFDHRACDRVGTGRQADTGDRGARAVVPGRAAISGEERQRDDLVGRRIGGPERREVERRKVWASQVRTFPPFESAPPATTRDRSRRYVQPPGTTGGSSVA